MIPHDFVPCHLRDLHGTEIDGVPVVWEPESTWAADAPMFMVISTPSFCGVACWCQADVRALPEPENRQRDVIYQYARYTPNRPPPRF